MLSPLETALTGQPFRRLYCRMLDELPLPHRGRGDVPALL